MRLLKLLGFSCFFSNHTKVHPEATYASSIAIPSHTTINDVDRFFDELDQKPIVWKKSAAFALPCEKTRKTQTYVQGQLVKSYPSHN